MLGFRVYGLGMKVLDTERNPAKALPRGLPASKGPDASISMALAPKS